MLDSGPLGELLRRSQKANPKSRLIFLEAVARGRRFILAEIVDYELRRNLLLEELTGSLNRLDDMKKHMTYAPLNTAIMQRAAALWAEARRGGLPTADRHALDGDVILAAQAQAAGAAVITDNPKHLGRFVKTLSWGDLAAK